MIDIAWFENIHPLSIDAECMRAFDNIDSQTLERFHNDYVKSNGKKKFRYVVLGVWTVDIKKRLKMLTDDPDKTSLHRIVLRGTSHKRNRPGS